MQNTVNEAKAELIRAKERIARVLATTPDDKINWSPSPCGRTPLQLVAHGALAIPGIQGILVGKPFPYANIVEADAAWRAAEKEFTTREQVLGLLEQNTAEYLAWLDTLTSEQVASTIQTLLGTNPMAVAITFAAYHLHNHAAQMDYIQTLYGDLDWHISNSEPV
jgi:DinB superfamily